MKAFTKTKYGGPEVLQLEEVEKPSLKDDHILVKVVANSANPADWHILRGEPFFARFSFGLFKPTNKILGADFAGIVEEVGKDVKHFKVGDGYLENPLKGELLLNTYVYQPMFVAKCRKEQVLLKWHVFPSQD